MKKDFSNLPLKNEERNDRRPQSSRLLLMLMALAMMMLAPFSMRGATTTLDFSQAGIAASNAAGGQTTYEANIVMSDQNYDAIGNGAKVGTSINYRYNSSAFKTIDISRLAFVVNTNGIGNQHVAGNGFYLRYQKIGNDRYSGLYTGQQASQLAILDLKPGDQVKIYFAASSDVESYGAGIFWRNYGWKGSGETVTISQLGDLIVEVNKGTIIQSITIESQIAEYTIRTNADGSSEFWFTAPGTLEENDFALPFMSVSMGSTSDYLVVQGTSDQNYAAHMIKTIGEGAGTETLETNGTNSQPSAGSFYSFKPTANGTVEVSGDLTSGGRVHLFVYANGNWVERESNNVFYRETFTSNSFSFSVENGKTYYLCINNQDQSEHGYAFHLHWFKFTNSFKVGALAKVIDLTNVSDGSWIELTSVTGYNSYNIHTKRCSGNITPPASEDYMIQNNFLYMKKPTFAEGTDNAGTVVIDVKTNGGDFVFVATFPYHADFNPVGYTDTDRTYGHTWNFMDPRVSDSNIGNCWINNGWDSFEKGTVSGILSIGQYNDVNSQFRRETDNREWTYGWVIKDLNGNITDPMYKNVFDMEGDNADMIWETEGLWFENATNLSCLYNENDEAVYEGGSPVQLQEWQTLDADPDRYVGLLADADKKSSFTIPGLKDGDRVLIFMKSSVKSGSDREAIFFNIEGARDAVGTVIDSGDLYGAGGTLWQHDRLEGCYHFIKDGDGDMTFYMVRGAICKLLSIRIYSGKRIDTNRVLRGGTSSLLFLNDEGTSQDDAAGGWYQMRFRGKGEQMDAKVIVHSGNLTDENSFAAGKFYINTNKTAITFKSTVGEFGVFRLRLMDMDFVHDGTGTTNNIPGQGYKYVCDFADRNFTVGYREKMSYPYTWDFTDMQTYSGTDIATENTLYPETTNKYERLGWDISLWGDDGYMVIGNSEDYQDDGDIFSQNKEGFGNQIYANKTIIPETQGLWFYMDSNLPKYNGCMQITSEGLHFVNTALSDDSHDPWWNYKMVVPSVPANAAVYLRMKRDSRVDEDDYKTGNNGDVLFLNTRFAWGTGSKTSLSESGSPYTVKENGAAYSFFKVDGTDDEYILAVKNTTGEENHLTFTLNGWTLKKVAVSPEEDYKKVNVKGWTTESRNHLVDPELTAYMTGQDFETCLVTGVDYEDKTVTLQRVNVAKKVMRNLTDGANGANIIHNKANEEAKVLANGFHLFVPDMHDFNMSTNTAGVKSMTNGNTDGTNMLIAQVTNSNGAKVIPASSTKDGKSYTNYALTYKYYKLNESGEATGSVIEGDEAFYRIVVGGASSSGNQGYLPLLTSSVDPSSSSYGTNPSNAKFTIIFEDEIQVEEEGVATLIDDVESTGHVTTTAGYYNLNGQKLNGQPTMSGLYIKNGKKVYVK